MSLIPQADPLPSPPSRPRLRVISSSAEQQGGVEGSAPAADMAEALLVSRESPSRSAHPPSLQLRPRDVAEWHSDLTVRRSVSNGPPRLSAEHQAAIEDFTRRWLLGECRGVESYLEQNRAVEDDLAVELIYREFCLAELDQRRPDPAAYLARFPAYQVKLGPRLAIHEGDAKDRGFDLGLTLSGAVDFEVGAEIGPYLLRRELGRGASARVFLAEEMDLENRLVVVKLTTRPTYEPWLLARVGHAHIVEILSYLMVDDGRCQLICMPFLGGATLSAVLARRHEPRSRRSGQGTLLRDLDAVAAPEYLDVSPARPAREILARLTDVQAMAWIAARLADALDHAFTQKVIHGDLKPSNILLAADGTPMLLDFNLAQDWSSEGTDSPDGTPGGTLAYMSPERLREVASPGRSGNPASPADSDPSLPSDSSAHRADIYALGMVLLESITGAAPPPARFDPDDATHPPKTPRQQALEFADFRERGADVVIGAAECKARGTIPPALREVLRRCLAGRPEERYGRALELAEDLNRWRAGRALAYAREPFWTSSLPRVLRRSSGLLAVAALAIVASLITATLLMRHSRAILEALAVQKATRTLDDPEVPPIQLQRPFHVDPPYADAELLPGGERALRDYEVLSHRAWRELPEFHNLPKQAQEDLELYLVEQALRYCEIHLSRPGSSLDVQRASLVLDDLDTDPPLRAVAELRRRWSGRMTEIPGRGLAQDLPSRRPSGREGEPGRRAPAAISPILDEYLLGVVAELEGDDPAMPAPKQPGRGNARTALSEAPPAIDSPLARRAIRALSHYEAVLERDPDSFWPHYRAAAACFSLNRWPEAAQHLEQCLRQRPGNAVLYGQMAGCLWFMKDRMNIEVSPERACDRAIELAPWMDKFHRTRALIRAGTGSMSEVEQDLEHFELLGRLRARSYFRSPPAQELGDARFAAVPATQRLLDLERSTEFLARSDDPLVRLDGDDLEELDMRLMVAATIGRVDADSSGDATRSSGLGQASKDEAKRALDIGIRELGRILAVKPDYLPAHVVRMVQLLKQSRAGEAEQELGLILDSSGLSVMLKKDLQSTRSLAIATGEFARAGRVEEALRLGGKLLELCHELDLPRGQAHYHLARARAIAARADPGQIAKVARNLHYATIANPRYRDWYRKDRDFDPMRAEIDAVLRRLEDSGHALDR